jgi:nicotinamidase-related amidase
LSRDGNNGTAVNESEQFLRRLQSAPRFSAVFNPWCESDSETDIGPAAPKIRRRQLAAYFAIDSAAQRSPWAQSGFANTDLNFQLKQHGVSHIIAVGLLANTCIESPGRFAMDFGYHVTLVRDATAAFSHEMMHAAHHLNGPTFAHSILTTQELPTPSQRARQLRGSPLPEEGSHGGRIF